MRYATFITWRNTHLAPKVTHYHAISVAMSDKRRSVAQQIRSGNFFGSLFRPTSGGALKLRAALRYTPPLRVLQAARNFNVAHNESTV